MKIGFTSTREGMTTEQLASVQEILNQHRNGEFHHGDCVGADAEAHAAAESLGMRIVIHPPLDHKLRAHLSAPHIFPSKPYIERNHDIVDETEAMIATPATSKMELRSGTWATVRYAVRMGRPVLVVWPSGNVVSWPEQVPMTRSG